MKVLVISTCLLLMHFQSAYLAVVKANDGQASVHFDFKTENGQQREENIKYDNKKVANNSAKVSKDLDDVNMKPVEYRGGYSFISADGYEYTVKYKANKNGFQPYVTAHKLKDPSAMV